MAQVQTCDIRKLENINLWEGGCSRTLVPTPNHPVHFSSIYMLPFFPQRCSLLATSYTHESSSSPASGTYSMWFQMVKWTQRPIGDCFPPPNLKSGPSVDCGYGRREAGVPQKAVLPECLIAITRNFDIWVTVASMFMFMPNLQSNRFTQSFWILEISRRWELPNLNVCAWACCIRADFHVLAISIKQGLPISAKLWLAEHFQVREY